jgi:hypothetical protein
MKMMRPQFLCCIDGRYARARRMPLSTLTSKKCFHSSSVISSKPFGSKMPRLLTRISTFGNFRATSLAAAAVLRSAAKADALFGAIAFSFATAASTDFDVRPLTMTRAPSRTSASAMAYPIPAVLPLTSASLPVRPRSMRGIVPG